MSHIGDEIAAEIDRQRFRKARLLTALSAIVLAGIAYAIAFSIDWRLAVALLLLKGSVNLGESLRHDRRT